MLAVETHDDVVRVHMWNVPGWLAGYSVSAYFRDGVLVDSGFPRAAGDLALWLDAVRPHGAVLTHSHEDHAGNAELLARRGVPLAAPAATLDMLRAREPHIGLYRRVMWGVTPLLRSPIEPLDLAANGLALVPSAGHSPDHHVVWDSARETLFGGDLFLGVKVRVARPMEDPRAIARSCRAAAALHPRRLFDAHRGLVPHPVEALLAKADWLEDAIGRIDALIAAGWRDRAISRRILGAEDASCWVTAGDLSRLNFVKAVRRGVPPSA